MTDDCRLHGGMLVWYRGLQEEQRKIEARLAAGERITEPERAIVRSGMDEMKAMERLARLSPCGKPEKESI